MKLPKRKISKLPLKASLTPCCCEKYPAIYIAPKMMFPTNLLPRENHKDIMQYETNYREYEEFYQELMELNE